MSTTFARTRAWSMLGGETAALPLDVFRVAAGVLAAAYFVDLWLDAPFFSDPEGRIDHRLSFELYPFTRLGLLQLPWGATGVRGLLAVGGAASIAVAAGFATRWAALAAFVSAVSIQRWNFLVLYADDVVVQLLLFWVVLLPLGRTVHLRAGWRREAWRHVRVRRLPMILFLANIFLVYAVAGLSKLTSPMWRDGTALYTILRLPIARDPDWLGPEHLSWMRFVSWAVLACEIAIPIGLLVRARWAARATCALQLGFHLGIVVSLGIPFANLGLLAALPLVARHEVVQRFGWARETRGPTLSVSASERLGAVVIGLLMLAGTWKIPGTTAAVAVAYGCLYTVGLTQNYHLFNWIDDRNYRRTIEVIRPGALSSDTDLREFLFPGDVRSVLLEMNLYGHRWLPAGTPGLAPELQASILRRLEAIACRAGAPSGTRVVATLHREWPGKPDRETTQRYDLHTLYCDRGAQMFSRPVLANPPVFDRIF